MLLKKSCSSSSSRHFLITALLFNTVLLPHPPASSSSPSQLGREEPAMSMDASGKVMWARHSEVQQANLKAMGEAEISDGERLALGVKDMGSCEIYPQTIQHSPNGR